MQCAMIWHSVVWYGMVWYGMVWYGMVWYGMVWYGTIWYGVVWYAMIWCGIVLYGVVWYVLWYGVLVEWVYYQCTFMFYNYVMFFQGCTFLAVFGLPGEKHEDDQARALKAAHRIIETLHTIREIT